MVVGFGLASLILDRISQIGVYPSITLEALDLSSGHPVKLM
jgi:hypothetical protein